MVYIYQIWTTDPSGTHLATTSTSRERAERAMPAAIARRNKAWKVKNVTAEIREVDKEHPFWK